MNHKPGIYCPSEPSAPCGKLARRSARGNQPMFRKEDIGHLGNFPSPTRAGRPLPGPALLNDFYKV